MARLTPTLKTQRDLGILSNNQCAFPGCSHPLLNDKGDYIAELCHIEAAEPGGERFNLNQSDEERRSIKNLIFLCHAHHVETNDVTKYTVERMLEIKKQHESLPRVVFDNELLLRRLDEIFTEQEKIKSIVTKSDQLQVTNKNYKIVGPQIQSSWTPENGRFYEDVCPEFGTKLKYSMKDGWLHIEQTFSDGAVAYYEVNERGDVRMNQMPYPINEYTVKIPESMVLSRTRVGSSVGTHAFKTELKWSAGSVIEHYQNNLFVGADCHTRVILKHAERLIEVVDKTKLPSM